MITPATAAALLLIAAPVSAHVEFTHADAPAGKPIEGKLVVGHGCAGSPTIRLRIKIPNGVVAVAPQPKKGWSSEIKTGRYAQPWTSGGQVFTEGAAEVIWSGRLPPHEHGTFSLQMQFADALKGQRILFPVVQECVKGVERWIDPSPDDENPAPALRVRTAS